MQTIAASSILPQMLHQTKLPLQIATAHVEQPEPDRIERVLGFMAAGFSAILDSLPVPRRTLPESTKALHLRVTLERRNGYCPCCQQVPVCDVDGRLAGAEFDHWYGRNRNAADETWLICSGCNRELETTHFKAGARSAFYAYQHAVLIFMAEAQRDLFE